MPPRPSADPAPSAPVRSAPARRGRSAGALAAPGAALALALAGCGNKGDLYLVEDGEVVPPPGLEDLDAPLDAPPGRPAGPAPPAAGDAPVAPADPNDVDAVPADDASGDPDARRRDRNRGRERAAS